MNNNCLNCNEIITNNFCSNCGQPAKLKRINQQYAWQELLNLIGYENGFVFTVKELITRPGKTVQEYIHINRKKITKPITFLILSSIIYTLVSQYFYTDIISNKQMEAFYGNSTYYKILIWVNNNYGYANLLMLLPITLWTKIFFRKYNYNFYETFVMVCLFMAEAMLFLAFTIVLNKFLEFPRIIYDSLTSFAMFLYISWMISIFYKKNIKNYIKAFLAYTFGFLTSQAMTFLVAVLYDSLIKK
ncbi:DUF3667 domain-containing protein [Empedobacter sedimenti]|uniref:DUF3667 domain-containing protein n=1 Tax=Empedobacter sedimenti TaxID=3042610 RepID=UPI0024A6EAAF|nr:DUF3667 domain-containing protein [Empedobacter sedimenti]